MGHCPGETLGMELQGKDPEGNFQLLRVVEVEGDQVTVDMNHPLAWSAGNALEVAEAIAYLRGDRRHERLHR